MNEKWTEGVSLFINAGPEDGIDYYDIWHNGGPGGPMLVAYHKDSAQVICAAVDELHLLRAENRKLRDVLEWVNVQCPGRCAGPCDAVLQGKAADIPQEQRAERIRERAAVVAWLRSQVSQAAGPGDLDLDWAADAIEAGVHRPGGDP